LDGTQYNDNSNVDNNYEGICGLQENQEIDRLIGIGGGGPWCVRGLEETLTSHKKCKLIT